ncbi:MAG TPA: type II toxin-antitoxin system death-on-curing family toxin [Dongiaceae bacterium]|nr:type II toxin-antitoxin system death-on-curing family toxin [Dongiaceae bacterium]
MTEPEWLSKDLMLAIHDEQLAEHGGGIGVRDTDLLDSALTRPQNRFAYDPASDLPALAAAYAFGLVRNHPFVDGNKRTAFVAAEVFLDLNGLIVTASDEACVLTMLRLAAGEMDEAEYAAWLRANSTTSDR